MNSIANAKATQDHDFQETVVSTASKAEILKRFDQAYQLSNQMYERIGEVVDTTYDNRSAIEAFQGTDEISTAQVDKLLHSLDHVFMVIHRDLDWVPKKP